MSTGTIDNTTPLRKGELRDPAKVHAVEAAGDSEPDKSTSSDAIKHANTPGTSGADTTGRAGGESAPTQAGEAGGPSLGGSSGGLKGTAGPNATAGGPFQSESGETLKTGEKYDTQFKTT